MFVVSFTKVQSRQITLLQVRQYILRGSLCLEHVICALFLMFILSRSSSRLLVLKSVGKRLTLPSGKG